MRGRRPRLRHSASMTQLVDVPASEGQEEAGGYLTRVFRATEEANRIAVMTALPKCPGGSLLDIGTHRGDFTMRVAEHTGAGEIHGIEFIADHAAAARERGIAAVEADIEDGLPFADESFDLVSANQVIEHLRGTDLFLAEIRRVLKPGGVACVSTNNLSSWHNVIALLFGFQPNPMHVSDEVIVGSPLNPEQGWKHEDRGRVHLRLFTARALVELAEHHGLAKRSLRGVGYYPLGARAARVAARVDPLHAAFLVATFSRA
jgi:SAM-dependent methyltransferase